MSRIVTVYQTGRSPAETPRAKGRRCDPLCFTDKPPTGAERERLLGQMRRLVKRLYPGVGAATLEVVPFGLAGYDDVRREVVIGRRSYDPDPGSAGAIAARILREIVRPAAEQAGAFTHLADIEAKTKLRHLRLVKCFEELAKWFGFLPADDLDVQELDVFFDEKSRPRFTPCRREVIRLFTEAGALPRS